MKIGRSGVSWQPFAVKEVEKATCVCIAYCSNIGIHFFDLPVLEGLRKVRDRVLCLRSELHGEKCNGLFRLSHSVDGREPEARGMRTPGGLPQAPKHNRKPRQLEIDNCKQNGLPPRNIEGLDKNEGALRLPYICKNFFRSGTSWLLFH
jgi:hypothetical protein